MAEKNPVGRPSDYDKKYCDEIVAFAKEGGTLAMFAVEKGVARSTLTEWAVSHEEFSVAVSRAKDARLAWLQKQANRLITNGSKEDGAAARMIEFAKSKEFREDYGDSPPNMENAVPTVIQIKVLKRGSED